MEENKELGICPSFSCYSSSNTIETAARVSKEFQQQEKEEDFEFSPNDVVSSETVFPVFNSHLLLKEKEHTIIDTYDDSLQSLFITEREGEPVEHEESVSSSESEEEEGSGMFCVFRNNNKSDQTSGGGLSKCKKSSSTGSGSKRWRIRDLLLMRSNSEGNKPMILITDNNNNNNNKNNNQIVKLEKRNSKEVAVKKQSVHELFYMQQRAKREDGKRKSYLPYRQGLIGRFF